MSSVKSYLEYWCCIKDSLVKFYLYVVGYFILALWVLWSWNNYIKSASQRKVGALKLPQTDKV